MDWGLLVCGVIALWIFLVDGVTLKPNTYYTLQKGKFVEVV